MHAPAFAQFSVIGKSKQAATRGNPRQLIEKHAQIARRWQQMGERGNEYHSAFKAIRSSRDTQGCWRSEAALKQLVDMFRTVKTVWERHVEPAMSQQLQPLLISSDYIRKQSATIIMDRPDLLLGSWGCLKSMPSFVCMPHDMLDSLELARARRFLRGLRDLTTSTMQITKNIHHVPTPWRD
jgi:hypothetical protein